MTISVVAANQAPTLLNVLTRSKCWNLFVSSMGDDAGLMEMDQCEVPVWPSEASPDLVLVCSPLQLTIARERWPHAKRIWLLHNGMNRSLLPTELEEHIDLAVCFSQRVAWLQGRRNIPVAWISPAYEVNPIWRWRKNYFWSMINRPWSRDDDRELVIPAVMQGYEFEMFGQDRPGGYIRADRKRELFASCSAYVSCLARSAGFGLAEHEAMASGTPILGYWWGDMDTEASYYPLQGKLTELQRWASYFAQSEELAWQASAAGLSYIREQRTADRMDETIRDVLSRVL